MGVRGTKFYAKHQEGNRFSVLSGTVTVSSIIQEVKPDGTVELKKQEIVLNENEHLTLTEKAKDIVDFKIEELTSDKLDAFALEIIKEVSEEEPETIKPSLLENINQVIEQKKEEAKQKEQERIVQEENQIIVFDQEVIQTSPVNNNWSSSSGSNDSVIQIIQVVQIIHHQLPLTQFQKLNGKIRWNFPKLFLQLPCQKILLLECLLMVKTSGGKMLI